MNGKNLEKVYVIEIKIVSLTSIARVTEKKGNKKSG
jgi:hypothetical protein